MSALHRGAIDYVLKSNLVCLPSAVRRALDFARLRRERRAEQARMARLDRVLRMLSGINALMVRVRERKELHGRGRFVLPPDWMGRQKTVSPVPSR